MPGGKHQRLLLDLARLSIERSSVAEVFSSFASRLVDGAAFDYASLLVWDRDQGSWRPVAIFPEEARVRLGGRTRMGLDDLEYVARFSEGLLFEVRPGRSPVHDFFHDLGLRWAWSITLQVGGEPFGVFTVARAADRPFGEDEQAVLREAARFLAHALREEIRLLIAERWGRRFELLNRIALELGRGGSVGVALKSLAEFDRGRPAVDLALVLQTGEGAPRPVGVFPGELRRWQRLPEEAWRWLAERAGGATTVVELEGAPAPLLAALEERRVPRLLHLPLASEGELLGCLLLGWREPGRPTPTDCSFGETLATLLGQGLGRERMLAALRREARERTAIARAAAAAAGAGGVEDVVRRLVPPVGLLLPRPAVGWWFPGDARAVFAAGRSRVAEVAAEALPPADDQPCWVSLPAVPAPLAALGVANPTVAVVPVARAGDLVGVLYAASRAGRMDADRRTLEQLGVVAQIVAPALRNWRMAEESERTRRATETILGALSEGVVLLDQDVRVVWANELGTRIVDLIDAERKLRGLEAHRPRMTKEAWTALATALQERRATRGRTRARIDGEERTFDFEIIPVDHAEYTAVAVARDVTAEVEAEARERRHQQELQQAARLATLGELISGVAHELNNPLTSVLGFAELLLERAEAEPLREDLELIRREAMRARDIVTDLLYIARPRPTERRSFRPSDIVGHVERLRRPEWNKRGIRVDISVREPPQPVLGPDQQLTQVLLNLVTNAEDALARAADPRLRIEARVADGRLHFAVADNGAPIPEEVRERIFEPFFTTKAGSGTGLGLSLSRSIVEAHGGSLRMREEGGWKYFEAEVPLDGGRPEPCPHPNGEHRSRERERILVVDDEPGIRAMLERVLGGAGHEVRAVGSVDEALEAVRAWRPSLLLCDYRLRGQTAEDLAEALERWAPELLRRTLLLTGAPTDPGVTALAGRLNAAVIAKPFSADELLAAIGGVPAT